MTAAITCSSEISFPTNGVPETKITPRSSAPSFAKRPSLFEDRQLHL
jgi:hypothetical protein